MVNNGQEMTEMIEDFNLLCDSGILGHYESCEVTEIFFLGENNNIFNLYTLVEFNASPYKKEKKFLTDGLVKLNKEFKFGIVQYNRELPEVRKQFAKLMKDGVWELCDPSKAVNLNLSPLRKQYIPADGTSNLPLNSVLKNNFFNGSYILEFWDLDKNNFEFILNDPALLKEISEKISKLMPVNLSLVSDRVGNIIFQFPNFYPKMAIGCRRDDKGISVDARRDDVQMSAFALTETSHTEGVLGFATEISHKQRFDLINGNSSTLTRTVVCDHETKLILGSFDGTSIDQISFNMNIITPGNLRSFRLPNEDLIQVQIQSEGNNSLIGDNSKSHIPWAQKRIYNNELDDLIRKKAFDQFGTFGKGTKEALNFVRDIISKYGEKGVYLWDPYLSSDDLKNTLFFNPCSDSVMRAIGSSKDIRGLNKKLTGDEKETHKNWLVDQRERLEPSEDEIYRGLNLEFRTKYGSHGFDFHDRFIICLQEKGACRVWSLGTSVNSLGDKHHIIMEVKHGVHILNAFNELWESLNHDECKVWSSKNA